MPVDDFPAAEMTSLKYTDMDLLPQILFIPNRSGSPASLPSSHTHLKPIFLLVPEVWEEG